MSTFVLALALVAYGVSTMSFVAHLATRRASLATTGLTALSVGIVVHIVGKALRIAVVGTLPVFDGNEALGALALVVAVLFVVAARRYRVPTLGAFAAPLVVVTLAASLAFSGEPGAVPTALRSAWFPVHLLLAISAEACLSVAGINAAAFLVQEARLKQKRPGPTLKLLPPLHLLEEITYRFVAVGLLLLSLAIVAGSLFAKQMWGAYWSWDPKQCFTMTTWLWFAAILHARVTAGWRGRKAAWMTLTGTALLIFAIVGLSAFVPTRHGGSFDGQKNAPSLTSTTTSSSMPPPTMNVAGHGGAR
jgi:cytochrome c-type biogenesis protein CcsB